MIITYTCPYCKQSYSEDLGSLGYDVMLDNDIDDNIEIGCDSCTNNFYLDIQMKISTRTSCELNGIEHDWHPYTSVGSNLIRCTHCKEIKVVDVEQLDFLSVV